MKLLFDVSIVSDSTKTLNFVRARFVSSATISCMLTPQTQRLSQCEVSTTLFSEEGVQGCWGGVAQKTDINLNTQDNYAILFPVAENMFPWRHLCFRRDGTRRPYCWPLPNVLMYEETDSSFMLIKQLWKFCLLPSTFGFTIRICFNLKRVSRCDVIQSCLILIYPEKYQPFL